MRTERGAQEHEHSVSVLATAIPCGRQYATTTMASRLSEQRRRTSYDSTTSYILPVPYLHIIVSSILKHDEHQYRTCLHIVFAIRPRMLRRWHTVPYLHIIVWQSKARWAPVPYVPAYCFSHSSKDAPPIAHGTSPMRRLPGEPFFRESSRARAQTLTRKDREGRTINEPLQNANNKYWYATAPSSLRFRVIGSTYTRDVRKHPHVVRSTC